MGSHSFKQLFVWQRANEVRKLVLDGAILFYGQGSAEELTDSVEFAHARGYWPDIVVVSGKLDEVGRMLRSLIRRTYEMG